MTVDRLVASPGMRPFSVGCIWVVVPCVGACVVRGWGVGGNPGGPEVQDFSCVGRGAFPRVCAGMPAALVLHLNPLQGPPKVGRG
jgi:hypothetical protein